MTLRPLGDQVLIDPEPDPTYAEATGTSIVLPDAYKTGPIDLAKWGRILDFGTDCQYDKRCWASDTNKPILHVGDRVLYGKFGWAKVEMESGKHLALVREKDIIAVAG